LKINILIIERKSYGWNLCKYNTLIIERKSYGWNLCKYNILIIERRMSMLIFEIWIYLLFKKELWLESLEIPYINY
jgi:hypothetical protein